MRMGDVGPHCCKASGSDLPGAGEAPAMPSATPCVVDDGASATGNAPSAAPSSSDAAPSSSRTSADAPPPPLPAGARDSDTVASSSGGEGQPVGNANESAGPSPPPPPASASPKGPPRPAQGSGSTLLSDLYKPPSPKGPFDSGELKKLLLLLVEFGGTFGTAAVVLGFFLKIDPFGEFHW